MIVCASFSIMDIVSLDLLDELACLVMVAWICYFFCFIDEIWIPMLCCPFWHVHTTFFSVFYKCTFAATFPSKIKEGKYAIKFNFSYHWKCINNVITLKSGFHEIYLSIWWVIQNAKKIYCYHTRFSESFFQIVLALVFIG